MVVYTYTADYVSQSDKNIFTRRSCFYFIKIIFFFCVISKTEFDIFVSLYTYV